MNNNRNNNHEDDNNYQQHRLQHKRQLHQLTILMRQVHAQQLTGAGSTQKGMPSSKRWSDESVS